MNNDYAIIIRPDRINFEPSNELEEIIQNVITICTTAKCTVPLDRELGVDGEVLDMPLTNAGAKYQAEIIRAVRKYEPRAKITRIEFYRDEEAKEFYPRIYLKLA